MKIKPTLRLTAGGLALILGLTGCSRTVDDVARWQASGNVEKLVKALEDPKKEVREAASYSLGEIKAESAVGPLSMLYTDEEESVTLAAVEALATIGTPATATPLIAALKLENADARQVAVKALGEQAAAGATDALIDELDDAETDIQILAAYSLGQIGDESAGAALAEKLKAPSEELRLTCVKSLGKTGGSVAAQGLATALEDESAAVRMAAIEAMTTVGEPAKPVVLEALKNPVKLIRQGAIQVLKQLDAIPTEGREAIWFKLAQQSITSDDTVDEKLIRYLASGGHIETLLEAATHEVESYREHAISALEWIGESCTEKVVKTAEKMAGESATAWLGNRTTWAGAPNWRLDLWGGASALNPNMKINSATETNLLQKGRSAFTTMTASSFETTRAVIPHLILLLGDRTKPDPEQPETDEFGVPVVRTERDTFRGTTNQQMAMEKLEKVGGKAVFPLIAAMSDSDELVAAHAAMVLSEIGDLRAATPIMDILSAKVDAGEKLTHSPFYVALQRFDVPESESLLLKIRPNSDRAMHVFDRKYDQVRALSAESPDASFDQTEPITYRIGYLEKGALKELEITFKKDEANDWKPSPALPDQLP